MKKNMVCIDNHSLEDIDKDAANSSPMPQFGPKYKIQPAFEDSKKYLNEIFERELKHETKRLSQKLGKELYLRKLIDEVGNFRFDINLRTKTEEVVKPAGKTQFGQFHIKIAEEKKKIYIGGYYFDKSSKEVYDNLSQVIESFKGPLKDFNVEKHYFLFQPDFKYDVSEEFKKEFLS